MPIVNGKYVNPGWVDNAPPAIDATELNAISDTLENLDNADPVTYTQGDGVSILNNEISARLSSQSNNTATFGPDGGLYVPAQTISGGGKRYATFVIGTSTAGWTEAECDYLCDGTDDDVEFNDAIRNFPQIGGEIVVLPGQYNISKTIVMQGIQSAPPGRISGAGSWTQSVHFVWTGEYTPSTISNLGSGENKYSMIYIWNGSVSGIFFDMNGGNQASGNVGVSLGTLGVCENCYFSSCPTSVNCSTIATVRNCYIGSGVGQQTYGVYCTGGFVLNNFFSAYGIDDCIYTKTARYSETLISGNILDGYSGGAGGITCTGSATATLVSNNILKNCTISDQTTTYHPTIVNNIEC